MKTFKEFIAEDGMGGGAAPANSAGGGAIAGIGIGKQGEPGVLPRKKKKSVGVVLTAEPLKRKM